MLMINRDQIRVGDHVTIRTRGKRGIYYAEFHRNGKHCRLTLKTCNRKEAEKRARQLEVELTSGEYKPRRSPIKLESAKEIFIKQKTAVALAKKSLVKYEQVLTDFINYATQRGIQNLQDITPLLFNHYREYLSSELAREPYGIYTESTIIKSFINTCVDHDLIDTSPIAKVKIKKPTTVLHPAPTLAQVNLILNMSEDNNLLVIAVGAFAGLRIGEIRDLTPADVDLEAGTIVVREGKTEAAARVVPIHPRLSGILQGYDGFKGKFLFNAPPSHRYPKGDHHLNPRTVNVVFKNLAQKADLHVGRKDQGLTFHALRRFFKTACLNAGLPKPLVDLWVGHEGGMGIDKHYYRPGDTKELMAKVAFDQY